MNDGNCIFVQLLEFMYFRWLVFRNKWNIERSARSSSHIKRVSIEYIKYKV